MGYRLIWPEQRTAHHGPARVGGKAAGLWRLRALGAPVPEWTVLVPVGRGGREEPSLQRHVRRIARRLGPGPFAVRSSSAGEDGRECSLAGQFESVLDVDLEGLADAVERVLASAGAPRGAAYARRTGADRGGMAVIVQRQLCPRFAGVLFTLDPTLRDTDGLFCEWGEGLAEARIAGREDAGRLRLDRRTGAIRGPAPAALREQLGALHALALRVERAFGTPVDLEWCIDASGPALVQARPITAIHGPGLSAWSSVNLNENFPQPLAPLARSMIVRFYGAYVAGYLRLAGLDAAEAAQWERRLGGWVDTVGDRLHYNLRAWYSLVAAFPLAPWLRRGLDHYLGVELPLALPVDPAARRFAHRWRRPWLAAGLATRLVVQHLRAETILRRFRDRFREARARWRTTPYDAQSPADLLARVDELLAFVQREYPAQCLADLEVVAFPALFRAAAARAGLDREAILAELTDVGAESAEQAHLVRTVARDAAGRPAAREALAAGDTVAAYAALGACGRRAADAFMAEFGTRCYHDCQLVSPTFEERPALFWSLVERALDQPTPVRAADRAALRGWWLRALRRRARRAIALRERGRIVRSLLFGELRGIFLALGRRLVASGRLADADAVFLLDLEELRGLAAGRGHLGGALEATLAARRAALAAARSARLPELVFVEAGRGPLSGGPPETAGEGALAGVPVANGRAEGRVRVVHCPLEETIEPGDILVAYAVDPGWTPLLTLCGGIVLEKGGVLSHAAIVAREFGIPAVTGVPGAMQRLRDVPAAIVDGYRGVVEPLAP